MPHSLAAEISRADGQAHGWAVVGIVAHRGCDGKFVFIFRVDRYVVIGMGNVKA